MNPTNQFIVDCLKIAAGLKHEAELDIQRLVRDEMDDNIYRLASDSALAPLVYTTLQETGLLEEIPANLAERLRTYYHFIAAKNSVALKDLQDVVSVIKDIPARFMLIKGSALILGEYYRNPGMRLLSDVDILVEDEETAREVEKRLLAGNFYQDQDAWEPPDFFSLAHHLPAIYSERGTMFEIHTGLTRLRQEAGWNLWDCSQTIKSKTEEEYLIPADEDLLLILAVNTAAHHADLMIPTYFKFMADLIAILKKNDGNLNWDRYFDTARKLGLYTVASSPISVASELLGMDALKSHPDVKESPFVDNMLKAMRGQIKSPKMSWMVTIMGEQNKLSAKLRILLYILFPPWEEIGRIYPTLSSPVLKWTAYIIRPFHLAVKYSYRDFLFAYRAGKSMKSTR